MPASKYDTHVKPHLKKISQWMSSGATGESIALKLGIQRSTWHNYIKKYTALADAITRGRSGQTDALNTTAFRAANGYTEETYEDRINKAGEKIRLFRTTYYPPDHKFYVLFRRNAIGDWIYGDVNGGEGSTNGLDKLTDAITASREKHGVG